MARKKTPQQELSSFWAAFHSKSKGKVTTIFPRALYTDLLPPAAPKRSKFLPGPDSPEAPTPSRNAQDSYQAAAAECRAKVRRIVAECERINQKFIDADFDIEHDWAHNCRNGLVRSGDRPQPVPGAEDAVSVEEINTDEYGIGSVHRVNWIFEKPQFTVNGYSSTDIKQGGSGDCWWLAAVATIAHRQDLMERVCVDRDEECGVYGFVFQRDGEWISTVIDDNLYLLASDWEEMAEDETYDPTGKRARRWRQREQTGSDALYFARCDDQNETWLPLLEKAYAKVHGDYESISGGYPGEAVEDMTGGVATTFASNRVLRKDKLWRELLIATKNNNGDDADGDQFVFSLGAMSQTDYYEKNGLALGHAYSVLQSREIPDDKDPNTLIRLVKIRNPWGRRNGSGLGEWEGAWSDGSKEWTPYWLEKLGHTFGDDGVFWMSFDDMLSTFAWVNRTRLFDSRWTTVQRWTAVHVAWVTGYLRTKFVVEVKQAGKVVIVLAQLDDRYFRGFSGGYRYELHFVLQNATTGERICRVRPADRGEIRSVSCEIDLEPGSYEILPKISATRRPGARSVEEVVREYAELNPQKLRQVGMQYDLAHAKGGVPDEDGALETRKAEAKRKRAERAARRKQRAAKHREKESTARLERRKKRAMRRAAKAVKAANKALEDVTATTATLDERKSEEAKEALKKESEAKTEVKSDEKPTAEPKAEPEAAPAVPVADAKSEPANLAIRPKVEDAVEKPLGATPDSKPSKPSEDVASTGEKSADVQAPMATGLSNAPEAKEVTPKVDAAASEALPAVEGEPAPKDDVPAAPSDAAPTLEEPPPPPPTVPDEPAAAATDTESVVSSDTETESEASSSDSDDSSDEYDSDGEAAPRKPWNAVCVIGLRVYTRDPAVTVTLVQPKNEVETSALTVEGEPAGATM